MFLFIDCAPIRLTIGYLKIGWICVNMLRSRHVISGEDHATSTKVPCVTLGGRDHEGRTQCMNYRQKGDFMERMCPVDYGMMDMVML